MLKRTLVNEGVLAHQAASYAKNHRIMKLDSEMAAAQKERTKQKELFTDLRAQLGSLVEKR